MYAFLVVRTVGSDILKKCIFFSEMEQLAVSSCRSYGSTLVSLLPGLFGSGWTGFEVVV